MKSLQVILLQLGPTYQEVCYSYERVNHSTLKIVKVKLKCKEGLGRICYHLNACQN